MYSLHLAWITPVTAGGLTLLFGVTFRPLPQLQEEAGTVILLLLLLYYSTLFHTIY